MIRNPFFITDGYKTGHHDMYPEGTEYVVTNGTFRSAKHAPMGMTKAMSIGQQKAIQLLHEHFEVSFFRRQYIQDAIELHLDQTDEAIQNFMDRTREIIIHKIESKYSEYLGTEYNGQHIRDLWNLGYLPIEVKIIPEGTMVPMGTPIITIENTHKDFAWITNFLETPISSMMWKMPVAASIAYMYKSILLNAAINTDNHNISFVDFQGHNFSSRGMDGIESGANAALGHDAVFMGDDTLMSLVDLDYYYDNQGGPSVYSVNATEHSVMCAGGDEDEIETFRFLMKQFPTGPLSIVSDTWNLWDVLTKHAVILKDEIMARNGKIIFRPDSGNPVNIICGINSAYEGHEMDPFPGIMVQHITNEVGEAEYKGIIELLWDVFGGTINDQGYKVLDPHVGAIYGDAITLERAKQIVDRLERKGFASTNIVLGIGSYTYQMNTRDTFGFAMKATHVTINGKGKDIFKNPITDDGRKKSAKGRLAVFNASGLCEADELLYDGTDIIVVKDQCTARQAKEGLLYTMYKDGKFVKRTDFSIIRKRVSMQIEADI